MKKRSRSVLLDTNLWRYLADEEAGDELRQTASRQRVQILVAPSVVYEAFRTSDPAVRQRLVEVMTRECWVRLMPEAYSESKEFHDEVQRLRPEWLRARPDPKLVIDLKRDWQQSAKGFWYRARHNTTAEVRTLQPLEGNTLEVARRQAEYGRKWAIEAGMTWENVNLSTLEAKPLLPLPGWDGHAVERWRLEALATFQSSVSATSHPFIDWLLPTVDLSRAVRSGTAWVSFWFHDVTAERVPRFWIRSALATLQSLKRVSDGTPCDSQLGTHLVECDYFLSADKVLVSIIQKCRTFAPFKIAEPLLVPAGARSVIDTLESLRNHRRSPRTR